MQNVLSKSHFQCPNPGHDTPHIKMFSPPDCMAGEDRVSHAGRIIEQIPEARPFIHPKDQQEKQLLCRLHEQLLTGSAWQDREARPHHLQTFTLAKDALARQLDKLGQTASAMMPVMIMDIDDMLVDSHTYWNGFIGRPYRNYGLRDTVWFLDPASKPLTGSVEFLNYAASRGVKIYYVGTRLSHPDIQAATCRMLNGLGFPQVDDSHVMTGSSKDVQTDAILGRLNEPVTVCTAGDKRTDLGYPKEPGREHERAWIKKNWQRVGEDLFIQPNSVYGCWESAVQFKYSHAPGKEVKARLKQAWKIAGCPDSPFVPGSEEQLQALLYSHSVDRMMACQQAAKGIEHRCRKIREQGKQPVVHIQLEGVLAETSPYVADLVTRGRYADARAISEGRLEEWLDYGVAKPSRQAVDLIRNLRKSAGAEIVVDVTVPPGRDTGEYCQTVYRWLKTAGLTDGSIVINTRRNDKLQSHELSLQTRMADGNEPVSEQIFVVPAPHQLWEWWQEDGSRECVAQQLQQAVRRWHLPEECSGIPLKTQEEQDREDRAQQEWEQVQRLEEESLYGGDTAGASPKGPPVTCRPPVPPITREKEAPHTAKKKKPKKRNIMYG